MHAELLVLVQVETEPHGYTAGRLGQHGQGGIWSTGHLSIVATLDA